MVVNEEERWLDVKREWLLLLMAIGCLLNQVPIILL